MLESTAELIAPGREDADLRRGDALRERIRLWRPQVIINAAAYTAVDAAEKEEELAHAINAEAPAAIAQEAAALGARLVHYSTDYVFDGHARVPYREDDPVAPLSAYGRTKLAGERAIRASGCRHLVLRTSWVYAPRGKNFVLTMLRLAREKPELRVVADQSGSPTSARSLARATAELLANDRVQGTFHATGAGVTTWHGFAERIVAAGARLGLCPVVPVRPIATADFPTPARRPAWSVLDNGRLFQESGVRLPPWEAALDECLQELR